MKLSLDNLIDRGGFSRVYVARVTSSSTALKGPLVVKKSHITKHVRHPTLQHEACAFLLLKGHPAMPLVYAWGRSQYYEYLAMEQLGQEADYALKTPGGLAMRNLIVLSCQMLDAVEHVHAHGIIHCDLKPSNFLFGLDGATAGQLKLIDFGLARNWRNLETKSHINQGTLPSLLGTIQYASIPIHLHHMPSRRDDFESLVYTIVKLLRGRLPWRNEEQTDTLRSKLAWSSADLCTGYPRVFADLVDYARALAFDEIPNYARWRRELRALVPDLPKNAVYEPLHAGEPRVGRPGVADIRPQAVAGVELKNLPSEHNEDSLPDSDDHWNPTSSWPPPHVIKDSDIFGDEASVVKAHLEKIEEPPTMEQPWLLKHLVETMDA